MNTLDFFINSSSFHHLTFGNMIMFSIVLILLYFGIYKKYEPLLLVPIAFGAFLANIPGENSLSVLLNEPQIKNNIQEIGGLYYYISKGVTYEIFPPLIFLGVGALTDFGPLIASPKNLLLGAAAQIGVFVALLLALLWGFNLGESSSIGIIGGADGPTAIFLSNHLAPELLGAIAVSAYSYMALVPLIQPPLMKLFTTKKERLIHMKTLRKVSKFERLSFPLLTTFFCILVVPPSAPLISMLMLGNLLRESGVTERLTAAAQNEIINIVTIFLATSVGITMNATNFLKIETLKILSLGILAFACSTIGGILMAKIMNLFLRKNPINPLIGAAGVSAVPMSARVVHNQAIKEDKNNFLLMHAMGPNVAGVIGTAVVAGYFLSLMSQ